MSFLKSVLKKSGLAYQQVEDEINLDHDQPASSDSQSAPENKASLISKLSFWWAQPLVKLGASRTLRRDDLGPFPSDIHTAAVDKEFLKIYDQQVEKAKLRINSEPTNLPEEQRKFLEKEEKGGFVNSIKWLRNSPLFRSFIIYGYRTLFWGGLLKFVAATGQVVSPLLLKLLLEHLGAVGTIDKQPIHFGYFFALGLFISAFTQAYALQCLYWIGFKFGSCYREASMSLVYRKLLRLSAASKRQATTGQMMNLVSVDAMRLMDFTWNPHDWWASPLIIIANMCVLYYMVGYPAIVGGLMLLALGGVNYYVTKLSLRYQEEIIGVSDDRISKISEMLTNIKFLKLYSWENIFRERATNVRESELSLLKKIAYLRALSSFLWTISPAIVSLLTFTLFTLTGGILTPSLAFTILAVNNSIREPIGKFFQCMNEVLKAWISTKRIGDFLSLEELDEPQHVQDNEYAVQINGDFTWDVDLPNPTMEDLSLKIPHGKLFIVVGPVGSGKTSLISAILGDIKRTKGDVLLSGKTVATSQSAWLMNASLRENILFGEPFNQNKYDKVIDRCALRRDIDGFTGGDQTEIGERGINLSGGQKQRVALARALYRESDIYIFDEPLGAVDSTVANWIFHECLMSHLAGKTRILVTHQLQFLPFADTVIVMENGRIKHKGTYNELMASGVELSSIVKNHTERLERIRSSSALLRKNSQEDLGNVSQEWENKIPPSQKNEEQQIVQEKKKPTPKLIQDEESEVGPLGFAIFGKYFGSSGNKHLFIIVIFFYLFSQMVRVGNDYWLVLWTGNAITPNPGIFFYLGIYAIWFLFSSSFVLTRELILAYSTLNCARNLHTNMLDCMLRAPMSFFDSTPIGRIVNRFSKDQSSIDDLLSSIFADVGHCGVTVLSTVVLICVLFPLLVPPMIVIAVLYFLIQRYYRRTARELKTMDAISRSPIFSYFSESANGVNTIRAYGRQTEFHKEFMNRVDDNEQCFYWHFAVNRWLGVRLEFVSALVVLATAMFSVTSANLGALETGLAGLSLSYALSITANLNWFVRQYTEMEINMTSVQRILQYTEVKSEAPIIIPNNRPQESWPEKPVIDFKKLFVRYTQGADYVLKGITCQIQPNEKIGIVGRTGAGKSSLTATLFRLIEAASGQIDIDNVNIADIGLFDLRTKLSIIPQDPFLFHGTIRFNLDPAGNHSDFEIWEALKKVNLKTIVENLPQQLDTHINENGDNFSLGQKQLFSLCRVILHKTKILILDEATASLDLETDEIIQTTVRKEFHDSTVLTIAHRLDTIIDSDRVMVLDKGELKELDKPEALLSNPDSIFSNLVSSALEATSQNKNRLEMS